MVNRRIWLTWEWVIGLQVERPVQSQSRDHTPRAGIERRQACVVLDLESLQIHSNIRQTFQAFKPSDNSICSFLPHFPYTWKLSKKNCVNLCTNWDIWSNIWKNCRKSNTIQGKLNQNRKNQRKIVTSWKSPRLSGKTCDLT